MSIVVPLTTEIRGGECEVTFPKPPWLRQESVANVLGIAGIDNARITSRLGTFPIEALSRVYDTIRKALAM
jgi:mRNA-degrading endonuclease toxin of MazEF toxin-antitoxin module